MRRHTRSPFYARTLDDVMSQNEPTTQLQTRKIKDWGHPKKCFTILKNKIAFAAFMARKKAVMEIAGFTAIKSDKPVVRRLRGGSCSSGPSTCHQPPRRCRSKLETIQSILLRS